MNTVEYGCQYLSNESQTLKFENIEVAIDFLVECERKNVVVLFIEKFYNMFHDSIRPINPVVFWFDFWNRCVKDF